MVNYLITGANRGIGHEVVKQLAQDSTNYIYALVRTEDKFSVFSEMKNVKPFALALDAEEEEFEKALKIIGEEGVDIVINVAGISAGGPGPIATKDLSNFDKLMKINVLAPMKLYKYVYSSLYKDSGVNKMFVNITSSVGSIKLMNTFFPGVAGFFDYGMSKTAANYYVKQIANENSMSEDPVIKKSIVLSLCPGGVKTDMNRAEREAGILPEEFFMEPEVAVKKILNTIHTADYSKNGLMVSHEGAIIDF